jgi:YHS domain-containing protein
MLTRSSPSELDKWEVSPVKSRNYLSGLMGVAVVGLVLSASREGHAQHQGHQHGAKSQTLSLPACPVMSDNPINLSISAATADGPVYFCCTDCIDTYKANPREYARQVAAQRQTLAALPKVQTTCPVMGKPIDKKISVDYRGQKVYFCCKGCDVKFQKNPKQYRAALANSYTYQMKCPVMGGAIDPQAFLQLADGRKVFFCCKGCDKKFASQPAKYLAKLESQGIHIAATDVTGAKPQHAGHQHSH